MIDPDAVYDKNGEWVELYNPTTDWLKIDGLKLADANIDEWEIEPFESKPIVVKPGGFAVICATADFFDNGGVDCLGEFYFFSLGKGFTMANEGDEVILLDGKNNTIDQVKYGSTFSEEGASLGVDPDYATASGNNTLSRWCSQWGSLAFGDSGSPGEKNDECW
jgi:hypothetical protein